MAEKAVFGRVEFWGFIVVDFLYVKAKVQIKSYDVWRCIFSLWFYWKKFYS